MSFHTGEQLDDGADPDFHFLLSSFESNKEYSGSCGRNIDLGCHASVAMQTVLVQVQLASIMKARLVRGGVAYLASLKDFRSHLSSGQDEKVKSCFQGLE